MLFASYLASIRKNKLLAVLVCPRPEEGLVSITPRKLLRTNVLVFKFLGPFVVRDIVKLFDMVDMVSFLTVSNVGTPRDYRNRSKGDVPPQATALLVVLLGVFDVFNESLCLLWVWLIRQTMVQTRESSRRLHSATTKHG